MKYLLVLLLSCLTFAQSEQDISTKNTRADSLRIAGNYKEAIKLAEKNYRTASQKWGKEHTETLRAMNILGLSYPKVNKFKEAEKILKFGLPAVIKKFGRGSINAIIFTDNLGLVYIEWGKYVEAEVVLSQNLALAKKVLSKNHSTTVQCSSNLATLYYHQGKYLVAKSLLYDSWAIAKKNWLEEHPLSLTIMNSLAETEKKLGEYEKAKILFEKCLRIKEKTIGEEHVDTLMTVSSLAGIYEIQGKYEAAKTLLEKCFDIAKKTLGKENNHTLIIMNNLAQLYKTIGYYKQAMTLSKECLQIRERVFGKAHPETLRCLSNLGSLLLVQGEYESARTLLEEVIAERTKVIGKNHFDTIQTKELLSEVYYSQGKYGKVESLYKEYIEQVEETFGKDHPEAIKIKSNLATLYYEQGKYKEAKDIYEKLITMENKISFHDFLHIMNNLASIYLKENLLDMAISTMKKCIQINENRREKNHPSTLVCLNNLGMMYFRSKRYEKAKVLVEECFKKQKERLAKDHPDILVTMNNLGLIYQEIPDYEKAENILSDCWQIQKEKYSGIHPANLRVLKNLLIICVLRGKYQQAVEISQKVISYLEDSFVYLLFVNDKNVQNYFLAQQSAFANIFLSLSEKVQNTEFTKIVVRFSLARKALLLSAQTSIQMGIHNNEESQIILDQLKQKQTYLAHLLFTPPQTLNLQSLENEKIKTKKNMEQLKQKLNLFDGSSLVWEKITIDDIQKSLGDSEAVVDFLVFEKVDFASRKYMGRYFLASVILYNRIYLIQLGSFLELQENIVSHRKLILNHNLDSRKLAQNLHESIWLPLEKYLSNIVQVIVIPDAELYMLSFASLRNKKGQYLIENFHLQICSSLRRIAYIKKTPPKSKQNVVIFANPDYNINIDQATNMQIHFDNLPGTQRENENIAKILRQKNIPYESYSEQKATKKNLLNIKNPKILHLATHGFFHAPTKNKILNIKDYLYRKTESIMLLGEPIDNSGKENMFFDPLNYCGLAFSGANKSSSKKSILLGTEVSTLYLVNTELVVLSACETNLGTLETLTSEGKIYKAEEVFSLRRAFEEAGAKAVLATMWPAADDATQQFMTRFYEIYLDKVPPQQALRAVQLEFLQSEKYSHPYFWANFVLVGTDKHFPEHTKNFDFGSLKKRPYLNLLYILIVFILFVLVVAFSYFFKLRAKEIEQKRLSRRQKRKNKGNLMLV